MEPITREKLKGQPKAEEVMSRFRSFIEGSIMVAHYADFGLCFVGSEFRRLGIYFRQPYYCTLAHGRKIFPELERCDLKILYRHLYNSEPEIMPRALEEARIAAKVWNKPVSNLENKYIIGCKIERKYSVYLSENEQKVTMYCNKMHLTYCYFTNCVFMAFELQQKNAMK